MAAPAPSPRPIDATIVAGGAHAVVAHAMGSEPPPLGLDRPLALLGEGERLAPSGMPSTIGIDHVPGLRAFVAEACRRSASAGGTAYRQPPLALLGERGAGKGFVAAWISRQAGVPLVRMRLDAVGACVGHEPDAAAVALPPLPIVALAASRCANPIVVVEIDAERPIPPDVEEALVSMIDPRRASRWVDRTTDAIVDLGNVSWILEVHRSVREPRAFYVRHDPPSALASPPFRLEALVREIGTVLDLDAFEADDRLRRLNVAACMCAAGGLEDPQAIADLLETLPPSNAAGGARVPCDQLVRHCLGWIAARRATGLRG